MVHVLAGVFTYFVVLVGVILVVDANGNNHNVAYRYSAATATTSAPTLSPMKSNETVAPAPIPLIPTESPSNHDGPPTATNAPIITPTVMPTTHKNSTDNNNTTKAPVAPTPSPSNSSPPHDVTPHSLPTTNTPTNTPNSNVTTAPTTTAPNSSTSTPTKAPTSNNNNTTSSPTNTPVTTPIVVPTTLAPGTTTQSPTTAAPQQSPTPPVIVPTPSSPQHHFSILKIIAKTIAWLIIIFLSVIAFGAAMSHRYRIYYFARGSYYTISRLLCRLPCTQYILSKLRFTSSGGSGNNNQSNYNDVNTIIFDNDMSEGLLMRESEYD